MTTAGPTLAGTGADGGGGGQGVWTNPTRITATDASYATRTLTGGVFVNSNWLRATNFGFAIPAGAVIDGLQCDVVVHDSTAAGLDTGLGDQWTKDGATAVGNDLALSHTLQMFDETLSYGGPANLAGATWTAADINASTFGFLWSARSRNSDIISVDSFAVTITYHLTSATAAGTFPSFTATAVAKQTQSATGAGTFPSFTASGIGNELPTSAGAGTFPSMTGTSTGTQTQSATAAGTFPSFTGSAGGTQTESATAAGTFPSFTGSAAALNSPGAATAAGTFASLVGAGVGMKSEGGRANVSDAKVGGTAAVSDRAYGADATDRATGGRAQARDD